MGHGAGGLARRTDGGAAGGLVRARAPGTARTVSSPAFIWWRWRLGVALISAQRGVDLTHLLFGSVLAVDNTALLAMAGAAS